ncbi:hypothetical protein RFM26_24590 [Mesorhizobium sp. VK23B]|uniref:Uncharacterized protein n=1 Tax=Mesorhizobium dulcispinae TaxID=3072316 RepID=A0ABU4XKQ5_9HYPH|nr:MULTISPECIES: hypothetical protein [unclassified Mesorhizobium]MDX8468891.1 hypothetical protein [Mesorhizobium sp. VK23B]MDX8475320.1 hypothetical protein [Mesorhizobium sp. VK23A]
MPRYATIITDDDGAEIVSAIGEFEGAHLPRRAGRVEQVAPGVRIGMVRGGPVEPIAGFGFPRQGPDPSVIAAVTTMLKATAPAPKLPISSLVGEIAGRPEGGAVPPASTIGKAASGQAASQKQPRTKPRKKPARKAAKARTARSPRAAVSEAAHG